MADKPVTNPVARGCARPHHCDVDTRMKVLAKSPLTRALTGSQREELDGILSAWSWGESDPLFHAGDELDGCYIIAAGRVRITHDTEDGEELTLDIVGPGAIVGPVATAPAVVDNSAWALDTSCALFLPAEALGQVVTTYPDMAMAIIQVQNQRLEAARRREIALSQDTVADRVRTVLGDMARKFGRPDKDGSVLINVRLRRQDIAGMAGTTVESASRAMATLKAQGVIDAGRQWVKIKKSAL